MLLSKVTRQNGDLFFAGCNLKSLKTPRFVYRKRTFQEQMGALRSQFGAIMPLEIYYSVKANPHPEIVKALARAGSSFLAYHPRHLRTLKTLAIPASRVLYFGPTLSGQEVRSALKEGISQFIVDSEQQLGLISAAKPAPPLSILVRIKPDEQKHKGVLYQERPSFGVSPKKALSILLTCAKLPFVKKIGIHLHTATQNTDAAGWLAELQRIEPVMVRLKKKNIHLDYLDLGGGFPIPYANNKAVSIETLGKIIKKPLRRFHGLFPKMRLILEPGRFLVGPAGILVSRVIQVREQGKIRSLTVDSSLYNSSMDTLIAGLQLPLLTNAQGPVCYHAIRGNSPDGLDIFRNKVSMPRARVGDCIVFLNAGAYTFSSDFCDLEKPKVEVV